MASCACVSVETENTVAAPARQPVAAFTLMVEGSSRVISNRRRIKGRAEEARGQV